jgi:hypothetical protein
MEATIIEKAKALYAEALQRRNYIQSHFGHYDQEEDAYVEAEFYVDLIEKHLGCVLK